MNNRRKIGTPYRGKFIKKLKLFEEKD